MVEGYASASELIRNLSHVRADYEVLETNQRFRIVRFATPFYDGSEFWVVNEKGFLWEPADSVEAAQTYMDSAEAREYNEAR